MLSNNLETLTRGTSVVSSTAPLTARDLSFFSNGVSYEYYRGDFDSIPNFEQLIPNAKGITKSINIDSYSEGEFTHDKIDPEVDLLIGDFAVKFTCKIKIPVEGIWMFRTSSNDGSVLYISGKKVVDNDGFHYQHDKTGKIPLKAGIYPLTVGYFHKSGKTLEGLRTGACLSLSFSVNVSRWSNGSEYRTEAKVPDHLLFYETVEEDIPNYMSTTKTKIEELETHVQSLNSKIEGLQTQNQIEKMRMQKFLNDLCNLNLNSTNETIVSENLSETERDFIFENHKRNVEKYNKKINLSLCRLKEDYFFSMGLALKLSGSMDSNISLIEAFEDNKDSTFVDKYAEIFQPTNTISQLDTTKNYVNK